MLKELIALDERVPESAVGWRASLVGHECETYLCHKRLGHESSAVSGRVRHMLDDGVTHEKDIVTRLEARGIKVLHSVFEGQLSALCEGGVLGHPDGVLDLPQGGTFELDYADPRFEFDKRFYLLEVTAWNHFTFQRIVREHLQGVLSRKYSQTQMYLSSPQVGEYTRYAIVVVKNKNTSELYEEGITYDESVVDGVLERLKRVEGLTSRGEVSDYRCSDWRKNTCDYRHLCHTEEEDEVQRRGVLKGESLSEAEELREVIETWRKGRELRREGEELVDDSRSYIRFLLDQYGAEGLTYEDVKASMVESSRRSTDYDTLRSLFPDVYNRVVQESTSRYVRVTG